MRRKNTTVRTVFFVILLEMVALPLLTYEHIIYLSLFNTLFLLVMAAKNLLTEVKAVYVAILGYAVMGFFDIFKYNIFNGILEDRAHLLTAYWMFISFFIFLSMYLITSFIFKRKQKILIVSTSKIKYIVIPLAIVFLLLYSASASAELNTNNPLAVLAGFFPKAITVVSFYFYLRTKKIFYFFIFLFFLVFSFNEISRRVYISFIFIVLPIILSYIHLRYGKMKGVHKFVISIIFIGAFIFMNFLRADYDFGEGKVEGDEMTSMVNYMLEFKAVDTFDNTAFVIENFPSKYDYYYGETYFAILVQFLPRSIWENKPVSFGAPLGLLKKVGIREFSIKTWRNEVNGLSFSPGFLGEAYANFGVFGMIFLSSIFGIATKIFDKMVHSNEVLNDVKMLPYMSAYSSFFLILRGDLLMATYYSILFYLFISLILVIGKRTVLIRGEHEN